MNHAKELSFEEGFEVKVFGKHIEITKPIEDYVLEKVAKVEKLNDHKVEMVVRLDVQKTTHTVDVMFKFSHIRVEVHAQTNDLYSAIDKAFDKLREKMRRWKSRIQDHHAKSVSMVEMDVNIFQQEHRDEVEVFNEEIEEQRLEEIAKEMSPPQIVTTKTRPLKTLTFDEAVMRMELTNDKFMIFRSEEEQKLRVIYRRDGGSYGVIAPE
ncbi:MAG: ribosome-associated translation inhibitor RaiA [Simkaniaceae bacterium]|nr:ribosome-associated translation inhibitor RaiA [Simkaniaceae bacterium]